MPAWNAARSIERALGSALRDPGLAVECVVVDDGSTDETAAVVERVASADPRVVLLRAPANEGPSAARNRALRVARGMWLTFLDADDRFVGGGLEALLRATVAGGILAVVGQRVWTDGRRRWQASSYRRRDIQEPGRKSLVTSPGLLYYASPTGKLFHRSVVGGLRFEGRILGDQPWTIRALIRAGDGIEVIGELVYEWIRPRSRRDTSTITAAKYASARLAAEAARVAARALSEVASEADMSLPDPASRSRIVAAYLDRLVNSDLNGPIVRAISRGDDGTDELFDAIGAFLDSVPPDLVEQSEAVARAILRPPLDRWARLREPAKSAYIRMLRAQVGAHPGLIPQISRFGPTRAGVRLLVSTEGRSETLAGVLLAVGWPFGLLNRWRRLVRLGLAWVRRPDVG